MCPVVRVSFFVRVRASGFPDPTLLPKVKRGSGDIHEMQVHMVIAPKLLGLTAGSYRALCSAGSFFWATAGSPKH